MTNLVTVKSILKLINDLPPCHYNAQSPKCCLPQWAEAARVTVRPTGPLMTGRIRDAVVFPRAAAIPRPGLDPVLKTRPMVTLAGRLLGRSRAPVPASATNA